jgi:hypothetical protein
MRNLLHPKWLFLINTLPIVVLFFLFTGEFNIIKSLLSAENIQQWKIFGSTLAVLGLLNFGYTLWLVIKNQKVSVLYGVLALICYIPFIYLVNFHSDKIIPFSIPRWMFSGESILYVGTFLMPTLAYSLFILVAHFTPETVEHKPGKNFLIAIITPIAWYLFAQIILPLWKPVEDNFSIHSSIIVVIIITLIFLFFLVRGVFIIATKKADVWQQQQLAWKIIISIVLPFIGLSVNNGNFFNDFASNSSGVFGNFSNYWFYLLALINGILICLPNHDNGLYRTLVFAGRSITFSYTFYFFLVFLPFLPLSAVAIVAIGMGFLMLTPLLLFVIHINELSNDFAYLKNRYSKNVIWLISVIGFLTIPIFITMTYLKDKAVLNEALDYIYNPNYSLDYEINKVSLQKTLDIVKDHKSRSRDMIFENQTPYLSSYFNWLVLNNLTLSYDKINAINKIFLSADTYNLSTRNTQDDNVKITNIATKSTFDTVQNAWLSWIDLEITNHNEHPRFSEYATTFQLPEGAWISDYYLYVGDKKEYGIISEKKAAFWIYSNIRNQNRDPGILYYLTGNKIAFRVFPFNKGEKRKTGIQILHKEPITFDLDNNTIKLGNEAIATMSSDSTTYENVVYISAKQKQTLKQVQRKPYFHFLLDVSKHKEKNTDDFAERIEQVLKSNISLSENAKISFINSYQKTIPFNNDWKQIYTAQTFEGGFYLDRGIRRALFDAYKNNSTTYPVFVMVTDKIQNAVLDKDFSDLKMAFPENDLFFSVHQNGNLQPHSLISDPIKPLNDTLKYTFDQPVLVYDLDNKKYYLPNNNQPSIILKNDIFDVGEQSIKEKNWQSALTMQGKWQSQILHPERSNKEWLSLVKLSFLSKVMVPVTSYLVVENEAQKAMLKRKQEQVLSSNKSLDLGDDAQPMSEPSIIILAALLGLILWFRQSRQRKWTN